MKYKLRFWFEYGDICIWGMNDNTKERYGYAIENSSLPISKEVINELNDLEKEYQSYIDWNEPQNSSLWTEEHKHDFINRANIVYEKLKKELGADYEISNEVMNSF